MANDLAFCRIDAQRRLERGSLGGRNIVVEQHSYRPGGRIGVDQAIYLSGPAASSRLLRKRWRSAEGLSLEALAGVSGTEFFEPEDRQARYDARVFFVRYLLDAAAGDLAAGFRAFLRSVAVADGAGAPELVAHLGRAWSDLERDFAAWLDRRGVPTPRRRARGGAPSLLGASAHSPSHRVEAHPGAAGNCVRGL